MNAAGTHGDVAECRSFARNRSRTMRKYTAKAKDPRHGESKDVNQLAQDQT